MDARQDNEDCLFALYRPFPSQNGWTFDQFIARRCQRKPS